MFKLAYLSFLATMVSTPVHFLADKSVTRWAVLCLIALTIAFVTAGNAREKQVERGQSGQGQSGQQGERGQRGSSD